MAHSRAHPPASGPPALRNFGTTQTDRVYESSALQAQSEQRSFRVHYRLRGVAVAYDDVVDVNVQVWETSGKPASAS
jgi:hypothetical protein